LRPSWQRLLLGEKQLRSHKEEEPNKHAQVWQPVSQNLIVVVGEGCGSSAKDAVEDIGDVVEAQTLSKENEAAYKPPVT